MENDAGVFHSKMVDVLAMESGLLKLPKIGNFPLKYETMGRNTSISLGEHHEEFINEQLRTGAYKNASEVIRAGLRLLEEQEEKIRMLRKALQEGIDSGITTDFDPDIFLKELKQSRSGNVDV